MRVCSEAFLVRRCPNPTIIACVPPSLAAPDLSEDSASSTVMQAEPPPARGAVRLQGQSPLTPGHRAVRCSSCSSLTGGPFLAYFRIDHESLGCRRTDHESLRLCQDGGTIGRDMRLRRNRFRWLSGAGRPQIWKLPARGAMGRHRGRRATYSRRCGTGEGTTGGRGQTRRRTVPSRR
jgi:hypothetical protein